MNPKLCAALTAAAIAASTAVALAVPAAADQEVYYKNCDAVRAAGKAPLYRGEPGYRPALDRDDDGVACEPRRGSGGSSDDGSKDGKDKRDDKDESSTTGDATKSSSTTSRSRADRSSPGGPSGSRSYGQIGEDDVPVGGVGTGGWPS